MRLTRTLLNASTPVSHAVKAPALNYNLGISYAAKYSPPFVPNNFRDKSPNSGLGFAGQSTKLGKWVDNMKSFPAGRGELSANEGGWDKELPERVWKWGAGEDFFAVADGGAWLNVAVSDGVGGWAPQYDSALYSQALMYHYAQALEKTPSMAPWDALSKAYAGVAQDDAVPAGSATAVGISLGETGKSRAVNLGDSGFAILRKGHLIYESEAQTHFFNCPYQLAKVPSKEKQNGAITDVPEHGQRLEFDLEPGDVVILYTDGLSDNLPSTQIPVLNAAVQRVLDVEQNAHLDRRERSSEHARLLADVLVAAGRSAMVRTGDEDGGKGWKTPFEEESAKHGQRLKGGKIDDITVVTAIVSENLSV